MSAAGSKTGNARGEQFPAPSKSSRVAVPFPTVVRRQDATAWVVSGRISHRQEARNVEPKQWESVLGLRSSDALPSHEHRRGTADIVGPGWA
jgi:hypothetical protein